jgi:hypothetical protein
MTADAKAGELIQEIILVREVREQSAFGCLEIAGRVVLNGMANSFTAASPLERRARIARRVGSAIAANVMLRGSINIVHQLVN